MANRLVSLALLLLLLLQTFCCSLSRKRQTGTLGARTWLRVTGEEADHAAIHQNRKGLEHASIIQKKEKFNQRGSKSGIDETDDLDNEKEEGGNTFGKQTNKHLEGGFLDTGQNGIEKGTDSLFPESVQGTEEIVSGRESKEGEQTHKIAKLTRTRVNGLSHEELLPKGKRHVSKAVVILLSVICALILTVLLVAFCSKISPRFAECVGRKNRVGYMPLKDADIEDGQSITIKEEERNAESCLRESSTSIGSPKDEQCSRGISAAQKTATAQLGLQIAPSRYDDTSVDCESSNDLGGRGLDNSAPDSLDMSSLSMIYMGIYNVIESDTSSDGSSHLSRTSSESEVVRHDTEAGWSGWPSYVVERVKERLPRSRSTGKAEARSHVVVLDDECASVLAKDVFSAPESVQIPITNKDRTGILLSNDKHSSDDSLYRQGIYETFTAYKDGLKKKDADETRICSYSGGKEMSQISPGLEESVEGKPFLKDIPLNHTLQEPTNKYSKDVLEMYQGEHFFNTVLKTRRKVYERTSSNTSLGRLGVVSGDAPALATPVNISEARKRLDRIKERRQRMLSNRDFRNMSHKVPNNCLETGQERRTDSKQELELCSRRNVHLDESLKQKLSNNVINDTEEEKSLHEEDKSIDLEGFIAETVGNGLEGQPCGSGVDTNISEQEPCGLQDVSIRTTDISRTISHENDQYDTMDRKYVAFDGRKLPTISEVAKKQLKVYNAVMRGEPLSPSCHEYKRLASCLKRWRDEIGPVRSHEDWGDYSYTPACLRFETPLPVRNKRTTGKSSSRKQLCSRSSNSLLEGEDPEGETCETVWTAFEHLVDSDTAVTNSEGQVVERGSSFASLERTSTDNTEAKWTARECSETLSFDSCYTERRELAPAQPSSPGAVVTGHYHEASHNSDEAAVLSGSLDIADISADHVVDRKKRTSKEACSEGGSSAGQEADHVISENDTVASDRNVERKSGSGSSMTSSLWTVTPESSLSVSSLTISSNSFPSIDDICHYSGEFVLARDVAVKENQSNYNRLISSETSGNMLSILSLERPSAVKGFGYLRKSMSDSGISILSHSIANAVTSRETRVQRTRDDIPKSNSDIEINKKAIDSCLDTPKEEIVNAVCDKCLQAGKAGGLRKRRWRFFKGIFKSRRVHVTSSDGCSTRNNEKKPNPTKRRFLKRNKNKT